MKKKTIGRRMLRSLSLTWASLSSLCIVAILSANPQNPDEQTNVCSSPGRLIDVGGFRLHIFCTGEPSRNPTVVLIHGLGDYSLDWGLVQPEIGRFTRVCSYDRAGVGWSDPGPSPRGPLTLTKELHSLLAKAGETGPFVLVGHSWGGLIARVYATQYPGAVAGMVLVDPTHEDMYWELNGPVVVPRLLTDAEWATMRPNGLSPRGVRVVAKLNPPFDRLPSDRQTLRGCVMALPLSGAQIAGGDVQDMRQDLAEVYSLARKKDGGYRIDDMPLVVLTKSSIGLSGPLGSEKIKYNDQLRDDLAHASRFGKHVVAGTSDHHIQLTEPALVIDAIRGTVTAAREVRATSR